MAFSGTPSAYRNVSPTIIEISLGVTDTPTTNRSPAGWIAQCAVLLRPSLKPRRCSWLPTLRRPAPKPPTRSRIDSYIRPSPVCCEPYRLESNTMSLTEPSLGQTLRRDAGVTVTAYCDNSPIGRAGRRVDFFRRSSDGRTPAISRPPLGASLSLFLYLHLLPLQLSSRFLFSSHLLSVLPCYPGLTAGRLWTAGRPT